MTVIGGMRTFWGPLLGAAVFVMLQDYILVVLFFPRGLLGTMRRRIAA